VDRATRGRLRRSGNGATPAFGPSRRGVKLKFSVSLRAWSIPQVFGAIFLGAILLEAGHLGVRVGDMCVPIHARTN